MQPIKDLEEIKELIRREFEILEMGGSVEDIEKFAMTKRDWFLKCGDMDAAREIEELFNTEMRKLYDKTRKVVPKPVEEKPAKKRSPFNWLNLRRRK